MKDLFEVIRPLDLMQTVIAMHHLITMALTSCDRQMNINSDLMSKRAAIWNGDFCMTMVGVIRTLRDLISNV